jgi:hypothetical protein
MMKPLPNARLASYDGRGFTLDCGDDRAEATTQATLIHCAVIVIG